MMWNRILAVGTAALLCATAASAAWHTSPEPIAGFGGLSFGAAPHAAGWLEATGTVDPACPCETVFRRDADHAWTYLGDARLADPGLRYRFFDDRLYAVEADIAADGRSFAALRRYLTERFGNPGVAETWQTAPRDTFVYRQRLATFGWFSADRKRSIWLSHSAAGGSLTVIDNSTAQARQVRISEHVGLRAERARVLAAR